MKRKSFGQIMPFLLVIIAIFLGAVVATVQIGKVSLNLTCVGNAADACALTAASMLARIQNTLKEAGGCMAKAYDDFLKDIKDNYVTPIKSNLGSVKTGDILAAKNNIANAYTKVNTASNYSSCGCWQAFSDAQQNLILAAGTATSAAGKFQSTSQKAAQIKPKRDSFNTKVKGKLSAAKGQINTAYTVAEQQAKASGHENNCVYVNLSSGELLTWTNGFNDSTPSNPNDPMTGSGIASWKDFQGQTHTGTATLTLPKIKSLILRVAPNDEPCPHKLQMPPLPGIAAPAIPGNDRYGNGALDALDTAMTLFNVSLGNAATAAGTIYSASCSLSWVTPLIGNGYCSPDPYSTIITPLVYPLQTKLSNYKTAINNLYNSTLLSGSGLTKHFDDIVNKYWAANKFKTMDVALGGGIGKALVIGIQDVIMQEPACPKCKYEFAVNGNPTQSSTAESTFGGGEHGGKGAGGASYGGNLLNTDGNGSPCTPGAGGSSGVNTQAPPGTGSGRNQCP